MAIDWGPYNGHLRVGIDHTINPSSPSHSDTTVDVTWKYYVDSDGWNFNDPEVLHESADGWGGRDDSFTNNSSGASILVGTTTVTYSISYSSGSKSASANLTGAYNGATPSHSVTVNLPDRPVAAPSAGEAPYWDTLYTNKADVSWNAPTDNGGDTVDKYECQVATGSGFASSAIVVDDTVLGSGFTNHTVTGLNPNTHYYLRVRAHNSAGWGDWTSSTYCQFTTLAGGPSTPGTPSLVSRDTQSINLAWQGSDANGGGTVTYTVQCASDSGFTNIVNTGTTTATSMAFGGLASNTTFYFRVKASNSGGTSAYSATLTATTMAVPIYTDANDVMGKMNNLASAVADKFVHLGTYLFMGRPLTPTIAAGATLNPDMQQLMGAACTQPDPPTANMVGDGNSNIATINYPGTYLIEFAWHPPGVTAASENDGYVTGILINGHAFPKTTDSHGGIERIDYAQPNSGGAYNTVMCVRQLVPGDTVGFYIYNHTSAAITLSGGDSDVCMWYRITMIGF